MKLFQYPILSFLLLFFSTAACAQDSLKTLSPAQLVEIVKRYHPIAIQAQNNVEQARAVLTMARALFDPFLQTEIAEKVFDGKQYYRYTQPQLTIPTWFGIELYAGAENLSGARTSPDETLGRTNYSGISVPLLKDLLIDRRRATLQQAKMLQHQSEAERRIALNNIVREALNTYWYWVQQQRLKTTIDQLVTVNETRLRLIKTAVELGERAAVDTVEALAQLQSFLGMQQEFSVAVQSALLELSFFLWTAETKPYNLPQDVIPEASAINANLLLSTSLDSLFTPDLVQHPELQQYDFKINSLAIEQRLKFQSLLPKLDLKYNQLGKGYNIIKSTTAPLLQHNYQYGISFALPLRLSEGRGAYRQARLKLQNTSLDRSLKALDLKNKANAYRAKVHGLQTQLQIQQAALQNYVALQRAEEMRFAAGESSLFLINARENKVLEARQKLIEVEIKLAEAFTDLQWAAGTLHKGLIQ